MGVSTTDPYKTFYKGSFGYCLHHNHYYEGEECDRCIKKNNPESWPIVRRLLDNSEFDD